MLYIPKVDNYLKVLTDEDMQDFEAKNVSEYFQSIREKQNLAKSLYIFLRTPNEVENYEIMCNQILLISVYITIMLRF